jgi:hypothetical protein
MKQMTLVPAPAVAAVMLHNLKKSAQSFSQVETMGGMMIGPGTMATCWPSGSILLTGLFWTYA